MLGQAYAELRHRNRNIDAQVDAAVNGTYLGSRTFAPRRDPLALDLDGDGLETTAIGTNPTLFDHDGDGVRTGTGWLKGDDAFLALDRNGNGLVDDGGELFGVDTFLANGQKAANGFAALADLDSNHDGVFNSLDAQYANVRLWRDLNQDGISQANELTTLSDAGIASINLTSTATNVALTGGNVQTAAGTYTRTNGQTGTVGDFTTGGTGNLDLAQNPFYSDFTTPVPLTDAAKTLPNMQGSGMVRDLQEAASLDATLASDVNGLSGLTRAQMMSALDALIERWADTSSMPTSVEQASANGFALTYLIPGMSVADYWAVRGLDATGGSSGGGGNIVIITEAERARLENLRAQQEALVARISLLERFNGLPFVTVGTTSVTTGQGTLVQAVDGQQSGGGTSGSSGTGIEITQYAYVSLNAGQVSLLDQSYAQLKESVYGGLVLETRLKPYLDQIKLTIDESGIKLDYSGMIAALDTLHTTDSVRAFTDVLDLTNFGSTLEWNSAQKLVDWAVEANASGQLTALKAGLATAFAGSLSGAPDIKIGTSGNDTLSTGAGNDVLIGGDGADWLHGDAGNDVFDGGAGNDSLSGGTGADTYLFGRGSGQDAIWNGDNDSDALGTNPDTVLLGAGIATDDVILTRSSDHLILSIKETTDNLSLLYYFSADATTGAAVENIKFADGTVWDIATVKAKVLEGTCGNDTLYGYATADTLSGGDGNDSLLGYAGNDVLDGGDGADSVNGGDGGDSLSGGAGNDNLSGEAGTDNLLGGDGADWLHGDAGNDILDGGTGNDSLSGGTGADTYLFGRGSGQDAIWNGDSDSDALGTNPDTILLGAGIATGDLILTRTGDHLILSINGTTDSLSLLYYFNADATTGAAVENIKFADGTVWSIATVKAQVQVGTAGDDTLYGTSGNDNLNGSDGNDKLYGNAGNDVLDGGNGADTLSGGDGGDSLSGGAGNDNLSGEAGTDNLLGGDGGDWLHGDAGNDILDGGTGNDSLSGGTGADTYLFGRGSGQDAIWNGDSDSDALGTNPDTILLGAGIATGDVALTRTGDHLILCIKGTSDNLSLLYYFSADATTGSAVENIKFADGTVWNIATVKAKMLEGSAGNDTLYGYATADTLSGGDGNDSLLGYAGNDVLDGSNGADTLSGGDGDDSLAGGAGNDTVSGDAGSDSLLGGDGADYLSGDVGNDTLDGGFGNDTLSGGTGADTYLFGRGSGQDAIYNGDGDALGTNPDTILLGVGIATGDAILTRTGDHLILSIKGTTDSLSLLYYFSADATTGSAVENIKFADGTVWNIATVKAKMLEGTAGNDRLLGYAGNDAIDGGNGADTLSGGDGNDNLAGGSGNDNLSGEAGADNLLGGDGADTLYGDAGNDTLDGGSGNDYLNGGAGNDTYVLARGYGQDTIGQSDTANADIDTCRFVGINSSDVVFHRYGNDLFSVVKDDWETRFYIPNYFAGSAYKIERFEFADNTVFGDSEVINRVSFYGTSGSDTLTGFTSSTNRLYGLDGNDALIGGALNDVLDGCVGVDTLSGGLGDDTYFVDNSGDVVAENANAGNDLVNSSVTLTLSANVEALVLVSTSAINGTGNNLDNLLRGNTVANTLNGGSGNDFLEGGTGDDMLTDTSGTGLFNGGAGTDTLTGGASAELYLGGTGNDTLTTAGGNDVICFNKGDGQDTFAAGGTGSDTVSLGGNFAYSDLTFSKSSSDLVLKMGASDQITFKNWYAATPSKPVVNLQVIAEAMAGFDAGGSDALLDQKVENFNFSGLVGAFDAARAANANLTSWALSNALATCNLGGSDTAALGGDLAYQYGKNGTLAGIGLTAAQDVIGASGFGTQAQTLRPLESLQTGSVRLS